jgi:hypothetical protein
MQNDLDTIIKFGLDDMYRILKSKFHARAYKIFWKGGKYFKEEIISKKNFENLYDLLVK